MNDMPELWWSPAVGLIRGGTNGGHEDAVRLVPAPDGQDLSKIADVLDTAERLAERVQRAVGEEGDVFDFASKERMEQADELSRELLPLAESILETDAVTLLHAHWGAS